MDVLEAIESRRSIRKYESTSIPADHLRKIVKAARLAPSAGNRQPWRFIVVRAPELKKRLAKAAREQMFIADAGAVVVAMADAEASPRWFEKDTMIAVEHMVLTATSLGYGTCWIGAFTEDDVRGILDIPKWIKVVALLPLGVPAESPGPKQRKHLNEIFHGEKYGRKLEL